MTRGGGSRAPSPLLLLALSLVVSGDVDSASADGVQPAEPRLRIVDYRPDQVVALTAFVGYHLHFEFAPNEHFLALGSGDTTGIDVAAEGNHLLLKPRKPSSGTNLTLLTNLRSYFLDYRALARVPRADEVVFSITFRYPEPTAAPDVGATHQRGYASDSALPQARNTDYWYCGSPELRPLAADDDGIQVRLRFSPSTELPTIYAAAADGAEMLVSTHVENDTLVVHRLSRRFVLRRGGLVGCVTDHSASRTARRASLGTLDENLERHTAEIDR